MIYVYTTPKTHFFLLNLFPRRIPLALPLPSCDLLLIHAHGHLAKRQLLGQLGLSDGFYRRAEALIKMLPTLSRVFRVRCYMPLELAKERDKAFYKAAEAAYSLLFRGEVPAPPPPPVLNKCIEGDGFVVVDNYLDYYALRSCGEWIFLDEPRPTPVEEYLLWGVLDREKYLKYLIEVYVLVK